MGDTREATGVQLVLFLRRAKAGKAHHRHHVVIVLLHGGVLCKLDAGLLAFRFLLCFLCCTSGGLTLADFGQPFLEVE